MIQITDLFLRLAVSFGTGLIISIIYRITNNNIVKDLTHPLILLNMIISLAMIAIGNNLASAFGLVGAVSIIRFRTSVKSPKDMAFLFFTIVTGMGCGLGYIKLILVGFTLISLVLLGIYFFSKNKIGNSIVKCKLKITCNNYNLKSELFEDLLERSFITHKISDIKISDNKVTIFYNLILSKIDDIDSFYNEFSKNQISDYKVQFLELE